MSELDEDTGYLVIKPGDRVFIEYDDPIHTALIGGWGTVVQVKNAWTAKILRDEGCGRPLTYCRLLLSPSPASEASPPSQSTGPRK